LQLQLLYDDQIYHDGQHKPLVGIDDIACDMAFRSDISIFIVSEILLFEDMANSLRQLKLERLTLPIIFH
jgi:hypothetical protein